MTAERRQLRCLSTQTLKWIAMALMLCDHMWGTIVSGNQWMTSIGRLAFPIFAFQIAEGFVRTHAFKQYLGRLFFWALVSEIPFNLMMGGRMVNPFDQNVLFTFCEALLLIKALDWARKKHFVLFLVLLPVVCIGGYFLGTMTLVDYGGSGVLTVLLFYLTRDLKFGWLIQLGGMFWINCRLMGGQIFLLHLLGRTVEVPEQGLALLALPLIWLYSGRQGRSSTAIRRACYAFYPVHMLILFLIRELLIAR